MGFENDVKVYGIQAISRMNTHAHMFDNDVKMYGIQAAQSPIHR